MTEQTIPHPPEQDQPDPDTEEKLARMFDITNQRATLETERLRLRDELAASLDGVRYFVDPGTGEKFYGYTSTPEPILVDLPLLKELVDDSVFKSVTEVQLNKEAFKRAVMGKRITQEVFLKVAKKQRGTTSIRFGDPRKPRRATD